MTTDLSSRHGWRADGRWGDNKNVKDQGKLNSRERTRRVDRDKNGKTKDGYKGRGTDVQDSAGKDVVSRKRERKEGLEEQGIDKRKHNGRTKDLDRDAVMEKDEASKACKEKKDETRGWTEVSKSGIGEPSKTKAREEIVLGNTIREVSIGKGLYNTLKLLEEHGSLEDAKELGGRNMDKKKSKLVGLRDDEEPREIHIVRRDKFGREMTPKEAYRNLSYIFHGKWPGKKNLENQRKQYLVEQKKKQMASSDGLQKSLERMWEAQRQQKTPYLSLS